MQFTFRDLEVFLAVMMSGSATRAGQTLGMTQPNVSKIIKLMELRIGVPLFQRVRGRLRATPEAEKLFAQAQHLQQEVLTFSKYAARIKSESTGILRICTLPLFSARLVPEAVSQFVKQFQGVEIRLEVGHEDRVIEAVSRGHADLGLIHFPQRETDELVKLDIIGQSPMGLAVHRDHRLADRKTIEPIDLIGERLISYPEFLPFRKAIDQALGDFTSEIQPEIIANFSSLALELVVRNVGVTFLDPLSLLHTYKDIRLIKFKNSPFIGVGLLSQPAQPSSILATKFRAILETELKNIINSTGI